MTQYLLVTHGIRKNQKSDKSANEIITKGEFNTDPDTLKTDTTIPKILYAKEKHIPQPWSLLLD